MFESGSVNAHCDISSQRSRNLKPSAAALTLTAIDRLSSSQAGRGLSSVKKLGGSSVYASMACLSNMPPIVRVSYINPVPVHYQLSNHSQLALMCH
jgi:hypothetical protein